MIATHYIEQYRQKDKQLVVSLSPKPIRQLQASLALTKKCNCITVAVWKIKLKKGCTLVTGEEINGSNILIAEYVK
jgi:hypothetical protein